MTLMPRNKVRTFYSPRHTPVLKRIILLDRRVLIEIESLDKSFILSWVIRLKSDRELVRDEVCPEEQEHCWADKVDSCTEWVRVSVSHTLVITARQAFTQHSDDVIPSQHAPPVPEDTGPAVLCKAPVNTRTRTHACTYMFKGLWCMCPQTYRHTHIHILANTHPNTPSSLHTNTPAVCPEPLAMLFVSSPLFRERPDLSQASYCVLVQTAGLCRVYLGADVWKHTLSASVSK